MRWKLGAKFSLFLVLIFLIGSGLKIFYLSKHFNRQAEQAIKERAELVLTSMQAVRNYTQTNIQPQLDRNNEDSDNFVLESVPNFAARTIFSDFRQQAPDFRDFSYKEAAPNPTNPDDFTDTFEADIVQQLRQQNNARPEILSGYRTSEGKKFFYLARPLFMKDSSCLKCHGDPRNAPPSLIKMYGDQNGFGWQLDDVIAAQMVYVPAGRILERGQQNLLAVTTILMSLFGALFVVINLLLWRTVIRPLKILTTVAKQISSCSIDEQHSIPEQSRDLATLINRKDEPGQLARAFHFMVQVLSQREQDLQLAVQEHTRSLEVEMRERHMAQESLQTYSHAISHDLRNLAMGISSVIQGILYKASGPNRPLQDGPKPSEIPIEPLALEMIQKSCDRQLKLMNSLMAVESSDIWQTALKVESVNLLQLVQELELVYGPKLAAMSSSFGYQLPPNLPDIHADPCQLKRVFENLIDNSLKYNPAGVSIELKATVWSQDSSMIRCTITDNGVGIGAKTSQDLFGMYARGHADSQVHGYGLGLYICRKLVEAHGGSIGVTTPSQGGVEFWFTVLVDR